jgi:hypothetical protein
VFKHLSVNGIFNHIILVTQKYDFDLGSGLAGVGGVRSLDVCQQ